MTLTVAISGFVEDKTIEKLGEKYNLNKASDTSEYDYEHTVLPVPVDFDKTNMDAVNYDIEKLLVLNKVNFANLAALINSSYGSDNLAALTILTNAQGYIMPKDFKDDFALYREYEGDYGAIVSFSEFGEGVISATMSFVKKGEKDNVFSRLYEISQGFGEDCIIAARVSY